MWQDVGKLPHGLISVGGDACSVQRSIYVVGLETHKDAGNLYGPGAVHRFNVDRGVLTVGAAGPIPTCGGTNGSMADEG